MLCALLIYDKNKKLNYSKYDLSEISIVYRLFVKNAIEDIAHESLKQIKPDNVYQITETVNDNKIIIYGYCYETSIIAITNPTYPQYLVRSLVSNIKNLNNLDKNFSNDIDKLWNQYCDMKHADKIQQIKTELDDTKTIIMESLEKLLERGESIDDLLVKSEDLKASSARFADKTRDMNRCCNIF